MAKKKSQPTAKNPAHQIRNAAAALAKRIDNWTKDNDDDSHADNMRPLLARDFRARKRKVLRTKV